MLPCSWRLRFPSSEISRCVSINFCLPHILLPQIIIYLALLQGSSSSTALLWTTFVLTLLETAAIIAYRWWQSDGALTWESFFGGNPLKSLSSTKQLEIELAASPSQSHNDKDVQEETSNQTADAEDGSAEKARSNSGLRPKRQTQAQADEQAESQTEESNAQTDGGRDIEGTQEEKAPKKRAKKAKNAKKAKQEREQEAEQSGKVNAEQQVVSSTTNADRVVLPEQNAELETEPDPDIDEKHSEATKTDATVSHASAASEASRSAEQVESQTSVAVDVAPTENARDDEQ